MLPAVARGAVPVAGLRWWVLAVAAGWQASVRAVAAPWGAPFARRGLGARRPVGHSAGRRFGRHAQQCVQRTAAMPPANRGANCKISCYNGNSGFAVNAAAANAHVGRLIWKESLIMELRELSIDRIHRAFSPAKEIQNPELFVGRKEEIRKGMAALMTKGGFLAILGLRGVGKSSIAYQIKLIAEGNDRLPKLLDLARFLPRKRFNYIVHYIRCDNFVRDIPTLLKRILFGDENNPSLFSLTKAGERQALEFKKVLEAQIGGNIIAAQASVKGSEEIRYAPYISDDLIGQFRQVLGMVTKDNWQKRSGLLILIDEFDIVENKRGFGSLIKACSSDFVKFGIVGVGTSISELISDHDSVGRQANIIHVPLMPEHELVHILKRAEHIVGRAITFDEAAQLEIARRSEGFPYFTHLMGKETMLLAFHRRNSLVTLADVQALFTTIVQGNLPTIYEDLYHRAVGNSTQKEILLKILADELQDEIYTKPAYALARELGIKNPTQAMRDLERDGIIIRVRDRYYRFSDPVFKVYARLRNWKE
ncbi:hypothetical protein D6779_11430 [Candidatus Parcubacteria bacterium]|nr:MAG: hypothetical protein D6779_11430 [Candidatus Parcubacteria bacterium]